MHLVGVGSAEQRVTWERHRAIRQAVALIASEALTEAQDVLWESLIRQARWSGIATTERHHHVP